MVTTFNSKTSTRTTTRSKRWNVRFKKHKPEGRGAKLGSDSMSTRTTVEAPMLGIRLLERSHSHKSKSTGSCLCTAALTSSSMAVTKSCSSAIPARCRNPFDRKNSGSLTSLFAKNSRSIVCSTWMESPTSSNPANRKST